MKKISLFTLMLFICIGCTENTMVRSYGGDATVNLPKGQKLIEATWKGADLWYLTEPMDSDYVPKVKLFKEDSQFGILQGSIKFVESR